MSAMSSQSEARRTMGVRKGEMLERLRPRSLRVLLVLETNVQFWLRLLRSTVSRAPERRLVAWHWNGADARFCMR